MALQSVESAQNRPEPNAVQASGKWQAARRPSPATAVSAGALDEAARPGVAAARRIGAAVRRRGRRGVSGGAALFERSSRGVASTSSRA